MLCMKSILQTEKSCYLCGRETCLERHHIFAGVANRKWSERLGLWVFLCADCHRGTDGAQYNHEVNRRLKMDAQNAFEQSHSRAEWMRAIGKNYL